VSRITYQQIKSVLIRIWIQFGHTGQIYGEK
jgi:hypothetical protein